MILALSLNGCTALNTLARRVNTLDVGFGVAYTDQQGNIFQVTQKLDATFANQKK